MRPSYTLNPSMSICIREFVGIFSAHIPLHSRLRLAAYGKTSAAMPRRFCVRRMAVFGVRRPMRLKQPDALRSLLVLVAAYQPADALVRV